MKASYSQDTYWLWEINKNYFILARIILNSIVSPLEYVFRFKLDSIFQKTISKFCWYLCYVIIFCIQTSLLQISCILSMEFRKKILTNFQRCFSLWIQILGMKSKCSVSYVCMPISQLRGWEKLIVCSQRKTLLWTEAINTTWWYLSLFLIFLVASLSYLFLSEYVDLP